MIKKFDYKPNTYKSNNNPFMVPIPNNNQLNQHTQHLFDHANISSNSSRTQHSSIITKLIRYCVFMFLVINTSCTQIQIIPTPTHQNLKSLNLMKSLRKFRIRHLNLQNTTYSCYTAIKQKPLQTKTQSQQKSKLYNTLINGNIPQNCKLDKDIFKTHLNLLIDDIGVRQYTKQFIYGYKHKKIVSQYDDQFTKHVNQKKQLENYTMGLFQLPNHINQKQQKVDLKPKTYQNYLILNNQQPNTNQLDNTPKPLNQKYAHQAIRYGHIDHNRRMISLLNPLQVYPHQVCKTYEIIFVCTGIKQGRKQSYNYSMVGISVTNFQIITLAEIPQGCHNVLAITKATKWAMGFSPLVNVLDKLLVGDLDSMCNIRHDQGLSEGDYILLRTERNVQYQENKVDVQKKNRKRVMNAGGQPQDFLSIQLDALTGQAVVMMGFDQESQAEPVQKKIRPLEEFFIVEINAIKGQNVYQMNTELPWTIKIKQCQKINFSPNRRIDYSGQIKTGNKILPPHYTIKNPQQDRLIELQTIGPKLIKKQVNQNSQYLQPGMDLFCMIEAKFAIDSTVSQIQYIGVTVGQEFGNDYMEIYPWERFQMLMFSGSVQLSGKMSCVPYLSWNGEKMRENTVDAINHVIKMSKLKNNRVKFHQLKGQNTDINKDSSQIHNKLNRDSILIITMTKNAVFQIQTTITSSTQPTTTSQQNPTQQPPNPKQQQPQQPIQPQQDNQITHNKYYINSNKIYKVETIFSNKTKIRLEKLENQFYQNSTNQNMIIFYNSIWRAGDFVKFPRFLFGDGEKITGIVVKFGSIFVRVVDLALFNPESFVVSSQEYLNHQGYGPRKRPQKSLATEYNFNHGTFCGGNINKPRQTTIKIRCGQSWYKLKSVTEIKPCVYEMQITSQYLCDKNVVFPALKQGFNTFQGSMCLPAALERDL